MSRCRLTACVPILALVLLLAACRSPRTTLPEAPIAAVEAERQAQRLRFLEEDQKRRTRLHEVSFPILLEAVDLFDARPRPALGILVASADSYLPPYRQLLEQQAAFTGQPVILHSATGSPARSAGIATGDRIRQLNGSVVAEQSSVFLEDLRAALAGGETIELQLQRNEELVQVSLKPALLADYRVHLRYDGRINARATGRAVEINRGMLDFCRNDAELAYIIAHELAHNALRHHRDYVINYLLGTAADLALLSVGVPTPNAVGFLNAIWRSPQYETEADLLALFLIARAGYEPREMLDLWPRLATLAPEKIPRTFVLRTHPDFASRQVRLRLAIEEIEDLRQAGHSLQPRAR